MAFGAGVGKAIVVGAKDRATNAVSALSNTDARRLQGFVADTPTGSRDITRRGSLRRHLEGGRCRAVGLEQFVKGDRADVSPGARS